MSRNVDRKTVEGFGDEWRSFDQTAMGEPEYAKLFADYFHICPWDKLPAGAVGADIGCGSGRWAKGVAPRVGQLHCVDPAAAALNVARANLAHCENVRFHEATTDELPFEDASLDFAYSLGVLHHIPDTASAMADCVRKLKPGAPFLVYLYYAFDNKPMWFRGIWRASDLFRQGISRTPFWLRKAITSAIALGVYYPLARGARLAEKAGVDVSNIPLSPYRHLSFYTMRTDALDRFGTRLEQRFSRAEIAAMMQAAGLENIRFSDGLPYWVACGIKR